MRNGHFPRAHAGAPRVRTLLRACLLMRACFLMLALCCLAALSQGCEPIREGVMRVTPGVPDPSGCVDGTQRCNGSVPEVCSASHRWWPALPPRADGTQRVCAASCAVTDAGVAVCAALDGGAR